MLVRLIAWIAIAWLEAITLFVVYSGVDMNVSVYDMLGELTPIDALVVTVSTVVVTIPSMGIAFEVTNLIYIEYPKLDRTHMSDVQGADWSRHRIMSFALAVAFNAVMGFMFAPTFFPLNAVLVSMCVFNVSAYSYQIAKEIADKYRKQA